VTVTGGIYPLRFFRVVPTQPSLIVWTFVFVVAVGVAAIVRDSARSVGGMVPILLLQLFAASSGFEVPARRGHYDLLLTSGHSRMWMAIVHWTTSVAPGVIAWLVLAAAELFSSRGADMRLLTMGTAAAMCLVSTLPWAITVRLPRYSGGIGWLLALAISTTVWPSAQLWPAWAFLLYPAGLVGHELDLHEATIAAPALLLAIAAMVVAFRWVWRTSIPLEAAQ
jgi:hypothetical protein